MKKFIILTLALLLIGVLSAKSLNTFNLYRLGMSFLQTDSLYVDDVYPQDHSHIKKSDTLFGEDIQIFVYFTRSIASKIEIRSERTAEKDQMLWYHDLLFKKLTELYGSPYNTVKGISSWLFEDNHIIKIIKAKDTDSKLYFVRIEFS